MVKRQPTIYQILIKLDDISPSIWRRILVKGNTTLLKLHDTIQIVMGWQNYHLHSFSMDERYYGNPEYDEFGDLGTIDDVNCKLENILTRNKQTFQYMYDFGDSWEHTLVVENSFPPEKGSRYPRCLEGKRACPPEDVGGSWGYGELLKFIQNPNAEEKDSFIFWPTEKIDPEMFNLENVNQQLQNMGRGISTESKSFWFVSEIFPQKTEIYRLAQNWAENLSETHQAVAENLPFRRDMVSMLKYLSKHKVRGTTSTGNFPLKAVDDICATFVIPPPLKRVIGNHDFLVRSEIEVWPLFILHSLAFIGRLVTGGEGRQWRLTAGGNEFLAATPSVQTYFLMALWWTQLNWTVDGYHDFANKVLGSGLETPALMQLLNLSDKTMIPIEIFYDRLIKDITLFMKLEENDRNQNWLQYLIKRLVVQPNFDLGILEVEFRATERLGKEFPEPLNIKATSFGKELLGQLTELVTSSPL